MLPVEPQAGSELLVTHLTRSTPRRLVALAAVAILAIIGAGVLAFIGATQMVGSTDRIQDSTGPVLIATQEVSAALAEADASATSVHLSGVDEDRQQRGLYESALDRAARGVSDMSRLVGDDPMSHDAIEQMSAALALYAGEVESARLSNRAGFDDADQRLVTALNLVRQEMTPQVQVVTEQAQQRLNEEVGSGATAVRISYVLFVLALLLLILGQVYLALRTRRLLNPFLVLATVLVVGSIYWLGSARSDQQDLLDEARIGGYDSIETTAKIQATAFRYKADESVALITGQSEDLLARRSTAVIDMSSTQIFRVAIAQAREGADIDGTPDGLLWDAARAADDPRERAATAEMIERWDRFQTTSAQMDDALAAGDRESALALALQSNSEFNGFNTAVESVVSDNRVQFQSSVDAADGALAWLRPVLLVLAGLAVLTTFIGYQTRIRDYR